MKRNAGWNFDNSYARLPKIFFSLQSPTAVREPKIVIFNEPLAEKLGLDSAALKSPEGALVFSGNETPVGALPIAKAYAGHQFGHFTMLGDGRAVLLGEQLTPDGQRFDIELKGSGRTPYSRGGDGRAALGPMLREYIISEAMHALNIPTTRSLAVVLTGEAVVRETKLPGAVLTRIAASHIRVGTFEYAANWGTKEDVKALADYTIARHYHTVKEAVNPYLSLLQEIIKRQAALIAKWQLVGFIHGVMNTDNMALSGETIDYGPCAFMDSYNPSTVFSSIDVRGRYAYANQPAIGAWNLARFAETLLPLLDENPDKTVEKAQDALAKYIDIYQDNWLSGIRKKLGIFNKEAEDINLAEGLFSMMHKYAADYTNTFRALTLNKLDSGGLFAAAEFTDWYDKWQKRLERQTESKEASQHLMRNENPLVIPRNHRVEEALAAAVENGDYSKMERLLRVLAEPYADTLKHEEYCTLPENREEPYRTFCGT